MKKSFLSIDAVMAVFILSIIYISLINFTKFEKEISYDFCNYLQIVGSLYSTSYLITELTAINPSGDLNTFYKIPYEIYHDTYYDCKLEKTVPIKYKLNDYVLYTNISGEIYATTTFGISNIYDEFYTLNGAGQPVSSCNYGTGC